jgi:hypothetical protein
MASTLREAELPRLVELFHEAALDSTRWRERGRIVDAPASGGGPIASLPRPPPQPRPAPAAAFASVPAPAAG